MTTPAGRGRWWRRRRRLLLAASLLLAALAVSSPWWLAAWTRAGHRRTLAAAESRFGPLTAARFAATVAERDPLWDGGEAGLLARLDRPSAPRPNLGHVVVDPATGRLDLDLESLTDVRRLHRSLAAGAQADLTAGRHAETVTAVHRLGWLAAWAEAEPTLYAHLVGLAVERDQLRLIGELAAADPGLAGGLRDALVDNDLRERLHTAAAFELVAVEAHATSDYVAHRLTDRGHDGAVEAAVDRLFIPFAAALAHRSRSENLRHWCALADAFEASGGFPAAGDPSLRQPRRDSLRLTPNLLEAVDRYRGIADRRRQIAVALAG